VTEEEVESAAAAQAHETMGIVDVINGDLLESCVAPTGVPGLSILPVGTATAHDASRISPAALRRVIEAARAQYDIVLVDTGPVPGSLEASATATQVDAMVLTVARGDNEPTVQRSISHLRSLGAQLAGLVFNRVRPRDMDDYEGSRRSSAAVSSGNGAQMHDSPESARLGPVARAVASFAPRSPNGSTARRE
jgi:Mrp family chromosome partitioning ATPase